MNSSRRRTFNVLARPAAFAVLGTLFGCGAGDEEAIAEAEPVPVSTVPVLWEDGYDRSVTFVGRVEARRESRVAFEVPGTVTDVTVDEGDAVSAGSPLAVLDQDRRSAQRDAADARLASARALLAELESGSRREVLDAARAEVASRKSDLELAQLTEGRRERIFRSASGTRQSYDEARLSAEVAMAALRSSEARLDELENGTRSEQVAAQRAAVEQAEADLKAAESDLSKSTLAAPFDGRVAERSVDEGEVVSAGMTAFRILETGRMEIRVGVSPAVAAELSVGDALTANVRGRTFEAVVRAVRPDRDASTRSVTILFSVDGDDLYSGDLAEVVVRRRSPVDGFSLPVSSLVEGVRGLWTCFVVAEQDGRLIADPRSVQILHVDGEAAFVTGPLEPNEPVVSDGVHRVVARQAVRPVSAPAAESASRENDGV